MDRLNYPRSQERPALGAAHLCPITGNNASGWSLMGGGFNQQGATDRGIIS